VAFYLVTPAIGEKGRIFIAMGEWRIQMTVVSGCYQPADWFRYCGYFMVGRLSVFLV